MIWVLRRSAAVGLATPRKIGLPIRLPSFRPQHSGPTQSPSPPPPSPPPPFGDPESFKEKLEARLARARARRSTGGGPPADELQSGYLPTFDPFSVRRIYHTPGAFRTAEAERALERKGWLEKESAFLAEAFARLLKRPPTGFTLFRRDVGFRVNPTLRPEQRLGELAQRLSHAWGVLPEVEKEAYRERSRKAYADANEDMRALKASYTATEIWWLSRYTTRGWWHSPRAVLGGVVDVLAQNEPTREELKQRALPRVRPPREVRLKQGMLTAPWRAFVNRWRASHPRPADVKHEAWFKSTVKAASTAWRADRAAEKAAADAAVAAEAAAEQRVVDARVAARREVERVELAKIRVKQGSILVDVRTKSVLADSKQGPPDVERSA